MFTLIYKFGFVLNYICYDLEFSFKGYQNLQESSVQEKLFRPTSTQNRRINICQTFRLFEARNTFSFFLQFA